VASRGAGYRASRFLSQMRVIVGCVATVIPRPWYLVPATFALALAFPPELADVSHYVIGIIIPVDTQSFL
jgi:hypothetical protein